MKCDIFFTAKEMNIEHEISPVHVSYNKREFICRKDTPISQAIILLEGYAKMYVDGMNNRNIILNVLIPSNYIGLISVFGSNDYNYNVTALGHCVTCQVNIQLVRNMYYSNPNFRDKLNNAFGLSVTSIMEKLVSLNQKHIRGKVADSLLYLSQLYDSTIFDLILTRRELGELSAISEENAVRVLTELRNEGIIEITGKEIELKDIEILKKISVIG